MWGKWDAEGKTLTQDTPAITLSSPQTTRSPNTILSRAASATFPVTTVAGSRQLGQGVGTQFKLSLS